MLAALLNTPKGDEDWARFSLHHRISHDVIRQAISDQRGVSLPAYELDPIPFFAFNQWLLLNQQSHSEMNNVLQVSGIDLEDLNPDDERVLRSWIYLHWQEHTTAERILGVAS